MSNQHTVPEHSEEPYKTRERIIAADQSLNAFLMQLSERVGVCGLEGEKKRVVWVG